MFQLEPPPLSSFSQPSSFLEGMVGRARCAFPSSDGDACTSPASLQPACKNPCRVTWCLPLLPDGFPGGLTPSCLCVKEFGPLPYPTGQCAVCQQLLCTISRTPPLGEPVRDTLLGGGSPTLAPVLLVTPGLALGSTGQMETKPQLFQLLFLMHAPQSSPAHGYRWEQSTGHWPIVIWPSSAYFFSSTSGFPL